MNLNSHAVTPQPDPASRPITIRPTIRMHLRRYFASRITASKKRGESFVLDDKGLVRDEVARQVIAFVATYHREHK